MRRTLAVALVVASCGGSPATTPTTSAYGRAADAYAATAFRAIEGTPFDVLGVGGLSDVVRDLCDGLGVGAMGVATADTGIVASDADVTVFLEVVRTGLDQVCEEKVVVDLASIYLRTVESAARDGGASSAYDAIAVLRAAPIVCDTFDAGSGAEDALLVVVESMYGVRAESIATLQIGADRGLVSGSVLAAATALVCPEHLPEVEAFMGSLP